MTEYVSTGSLRRGVVRRLVPYDEPICTRCDGAGTCEVCGGPAELLGRLADDLAAHAVSLGTVTPDYKSRGTRESDAVAALLAEASAALGRDVG